MNRPKYTEEFLAVIFFILGGIFIAMGLLCFIGVVRPSARSMVQIPAMLGIVYSFIGIAFCLAMLILKANAAAKKNLHKELLANGNKINGIVEKVHFQRSIQYGKESPYRIYYTYTDQGKEFHRKSYLLWEKPDYLKGDQIEVFANHLGKSTIRL